MLAFIGFCGVVTDGRPDLPRWLQTTAALLSVAALALACIAVFLVASVAWPVTARRGGFPARSEDAASSTDQSRPRLTAGVVLTFVAVALMALAASANWWPVDAGGDPGDSSSAADRTAAVVEAVDASGNRWCGRLADPDNPGTVVLTTERGGVELVLARLARLGPVPAC